MMDDLVKCKDIIDIVIDVTREEIGRSKPFVDTLAKVLGVLPDYNVSQISRLVYQSRRSNS